MSWVGRSSHAICQPGMKWRVKCNEMNFSWAPHYPLTFRRLVCSSYLSSCDLFLYGYLKIQIIKQQTAEQLKILYSWNWSKTMSKNNFSYYIFSNIKSFKHNCKLSDKTMPYQSFNFQYWKSTLHKIVYELTSLKWTTWRWVFNL